MSTVVSSRVKLKWPHRESDHLNPSHAEVKIAWIVSKTKLILPLTFSITVAGALKTFRIVSAMAWISENSWIVVTDGAFGRQFNNSMEICYSTCQLILSFTVADYFTFDTARFQDTTTALLTLLRCRKVVCRQFSYGGIKKNIKNNPTRSRSFAHLTVNFCLE